MCLADAAPGRLCRRSNTGTTGQREFHTVNDVGRGRGSAYALSLAPSPLQSRLCAFEEAYAFLLGKCRHDSQHDVAHHLVVSAQERFRIAVEGHARRSKAL